MQNKISENFYRGARFFLNNPQISYLIFVAAVIVASFLFVSQMFTNIVVETQERFEQHRLSSMHDVFIELAKRELNNPNYLNKVIEEVSKKNETITSFDVIKKTGNKMVIIASLDKEKIGREPKEDVQIFNTALVNPDSSFSFEVFDGGKRHFKVVRSIKADDGDVIGWVLTESSLSQFDELTRNNIKTTYFILLLILIVIIILLIRHARIIDYATLYKRLKEVDKMKDDFVAMASHELRTPLTVIRGYADLLKGIKGLSEKDRENIERIDIATAELEELIEDILDVSRLSQGRFLINMQKVNVVEIAKNVVENFKQAAEEKNLSLVFSTDNDILNIDADPNRLRQVLINLVGNAIKYTKQGEVAVKIKKEKDEVVIRVSDSGIGISEEERKNLFKKFYRIRNEDTKEIKGTGLGLWITKQIVEKMNGKISVESIKGVGSHFIVKFPIKNN